MEKILSIITSIITSILSEGSFPLVWITIKLPSVFYKIIRGLKREKTIEKGECKSQILDAKGHYQVFQHSMAKASKTGRKLRLSCSEFNKKQKKCRYFGTCEVWESN